MPGYNINLNPVTLQDSTLTFICPQTSPMGSVLIVTFTVNFNTQHISQKLFAVPLDHRTHERSAAVEALSAAQREFLR